MLTPEQLEERRLRAIEMLQDGETQEGVAEELGVTRNAVYFWWRAYRQQGRQGLARRPHTGRKPRTDRKVLEKIPALLNKGAESYGFEGDVWTLDRVREVIQSEFGLEYSTRHVGKILAKLGLVWKKPVRRPVERDEAEIRRWVKEDWPKIKKGRRSSAR
jgi:transposase